MKSFDVVAETRRRWPAEERRRILAETENEAVSVVARRHGVAASLVFRWRRQAGMAAKRKPVKRDQTSFVPVVLPAPVASPAAIVERSTVPAPDRGLIEIVLAGGRLLRVGGDVETEALRRVIAVLEGR